MAIVFAYTPATNTVVQTGGTSGTPATFADFVTADLAGTFDLLSRTGIGAVDGSPVAVTNALRPTDACVMGTNAAGKSLAIVVSAWTNMTAATVSIVGTDGVGAALSETIALLGNGTYYTVGLYKTVTSTQITVWTGTGSFAYTLTQGKWGVIWNYGNQQYRIDSHFDIGDSSTSTYFTSLLDNAYWPDNVRPHVTAQATLKMGEVATGYPTSGGPCWSWKCEGFTNNFTETGSTFLGYGILIRSRGDSNDDLEFWGSAIIQDSLLVCNGTGPNSIIFENVGIAINGLIVIKPRLLVFTVTPTTAPERLNSTNAVIASIQAQAHIIVRGLIINNPGTNDCYARNYNLTLINPSVLVSNPYILNNGNFIKECYSCNVNISDKLGTNLSGASLLIQDTSGNVISYSDSGTNTSAGMTTGSTSVNTGDGTKFSINQYVLIDGEWMLITNIVENTIHVTRAQYSTIATIHTTGADIYIARAVSTDGNGNISELFIVYKQWVNMALTLTTYSPHTFTISKSGYQTLVLENITVDHPIVWHLELQRAHLRMVRNRRDLVLDQ